MTLNVSAFAATGDPGIGRVAKAMEKVGDTCEFALDSFGRLNVIEAISQRVYWGITYLEALNQYYHIRSKQPDRPGFKEFYNASVLAAEREQRTNDHGREALVRAQIAPDLDVLPPHHTEFFFSVLVRAWPDITVTEQSSS